MGAGSRGSSTRPTVYVDGGTTAIRQDVNAALQELVAIAHPRHAALIVLIESPGESPSAGVRRIARCRESNPVATLLFLTTSAPSQTTAVDAFRAHVTDYLRWPLERGRFDAWCSRLGPAAEPQTTLVGTSSVMNELRTTLRQLAAVNCRVLLRGETGTGKEVAARALHTWSRRANRPFVTINCPAIPDTLFESELFGFERGAFSGAVRSYAGRLVEADQGTLFLDEVGELPLSVQAKLLRAMEHSEVQRLGARGAQRVDVRWIAATNRDLHAMVRAGTFRADLFYRLCVAETVLPPLRTRRDDVAGLTAHFSALVASELDLVSGGVLPTTMTALESHDWPGNVRELRNAIETSLIRAAGAPVCPSHLPLAVTTPLTARPIDEAERPGFSTRSSRCAGTRVRRPRSCSGRA